ncbi:telomere stability and silencing-domain-containing protein [Dipodascopsis uninucleata]
MVYVHLTTVNSLLPIAGVFDDGISLNVIAESLFSQLPSAVRNSCYVANRSGKAIASIADNEVRNDIIELFLRPRLCGGKGGFGSQLRAQGGRMAASRRKRGDQDTNDSFRNLDGRRMRSIRQAKELAHYLETAPTRIREAAEKKKERLQAIINYSHPSTNAKFDDTEFLDQSEAMIDEIKRIVSEVSPDDAKALFTSLFDDRMDDTKEESDNDEMMNKSIKNIDMELNEKQVISGSPGERKPVLASFFDEDDSDASDASDGSDQDDLE